MPIVINNSTTTSNTSNIMATFPQGSGSYYTTSTSAINSTLTIHTAKGTSIIIDDYFVEYMDLLSALLGIECSFTEFCAMSSKDKAIFFKSLKREIKLKNLDI